MFGEPPSHCVESEGQRLGFPGFIKGGDGELSKNPVWTLGLFEPSSRRKRSGALTASMAPLLMLPKL